MKKPSSLLCGIFILGVLFSGILFGLAINHRPARTALINEAYAASESGTVILADHGVIRFMVDGEEQARIDSAGIHVNGNVRYSGSLTDTQAYDISRPAIAQEQTP